MRTLALLCLLATVAWCEDALSVFGEKWVVPEAGDWKVSSDNGGEVLQLLKSRGPLAGPRRPIQFAIAQTAAFAKATLTLDARPKQRSLILVFAYQDAAHFDYAHLSFDTGIEQPVHNGIFHVFGGERVRISPQAGRAAFGKPGQWYHVVVSDSRVTGAVEVSVNGNALPALRAVDMSLRSGRIGLGSFDETADFKNVHIAGSSAEAR